jgi:hypothetical protein
MQLPGAEPSIVLAADDAITLDRICPFFNPCPVYHLTIKGDGTTLFAGGQLTSPKSKVTGSVSKEQLKELLIAFDRANFLSLGNYECNTLLSGGCPTDLPFTVTTITTQGTTKTVRHYSPDRTAPQELTALECKIDEVAGTQQWVTVPIPGCK